MLWVDKWKPKSAADLVGNISAQNIMRQWLKDWHRVHVLGGAASQAPGARGAKLDLSKKALLISGSPGTGKTTAAQIIGRCANFEFSNISKHGDWRGCKASSLQGIALLLLATERHLVVECCLDTNYGG
jgi:replication factor C subunit 1